MAQVFSRQHCYRSVIRSDCSIGVARGLCDNAILVYLETLLSTVPRLSRGSGTLGLCQDLLKSYISAHPLLVMAAKRIATLLALMNLRWCDFRMSPFRDILQMTFLEYIVIKCIRGMFHHEALSARCSSAHKVASSCSLSE